MAFFRSTARPLRVEFSGRVYHLTIQGNAQQPIFSSPEDREAFLGILASTVERFHWLCHAYCLMNNHDHLLVETQEANLLRGMRQLNGVDTQRFHRTHERAGHLFQGRCKAIVVRKEAHWLELSPYVVLNPVRTGMVKRAKDWRWSSYGEAAGLEKVPEFLTVDWIGGQFPRGRRAACRLYQAFVAEGAGQEPPWGSLNGQIFWGGERSLRMC